MSTHLCSIHDARNGEKCCSNKAMFYRTFVGASTELDSHHLLIATITQWMPVFVIPYGTHVDLCVVNYIASKWHTAKSKHIKCLWYFRTCYGHPFIYTHNFIVICHQSRKVELWRELNWNNILWVELPLLKKSSQFVAWKTSQIVAWILVFSSCGNDSRIWFIWYEGLISLYYHYSKWMTCHVNLA